MLIFQSVSERGGGEEKVDAPLRRTWRSGTPCLRDGIRFGQCMVPDRSTPYGQLIPVVGRAKQGLLDNRTQLSNLIHFLPVTPHPSF